MRRTMIVVLAGFLMVQMLLWPVVVMAQELPAVAVLDFHNASGDPQLEHLQTSIPEGLVTDLARRGDLSLVERKRLKALMGEIALGMTGAIDAEQAVQMGQQVGARMVVLGSYNATEGQLEINARVVDVASGQIAHGEQVEGKLKDQSKLVRRLGGRLWAYWTGNPIPKEGKPLFAKWWFWGGLVLIGGGAAAATQGGGETGPASLPSFPGPPE